MRLPILALCAVFMVVSPCWSHAAPFAVPLWNGAVPGPTSDKQEVIRDLPVSDNTDAARNRHILGVTNPTMSVYLPEKPRSDAPALLILPGGGFNILVMDREGHEVARWLTTHGIAGIVVKYRLPDLEAGLYVRNASLVDIKRAVRMTRAHAEDWRIDPNRIGVMGFSAGGYLTAAVGTMFDNGDRMRTMSSSKSAAAPTLSHPSTRWCRSGNSSMTKGSCRASLARPSTLNGGCVTRPRRG